MSFCRRSLLDTAIANKKGSGAKRLSLLSGCIYFPQYATLRVGGVTPY